jgi:hypothetical protein
MKYIYVVTTMFISKKNENNKKWFKKRERTPGWFPSFKRAEIAVLNNYGDIHEEEYNYAVIEKMGPGFYNFGLKDHWYKWNEKIERYEKTQCPECCKCTCGWGIG